MPSFADSATADFFRARLDHMIDLRHELAVLTSHMPWQKLEATLAHRLSRQAIAGKKLPGIDLFGEAIALTPRPSQAGRPRVPLRIMMALLYLQNAFNLSDEAAVARWAENPYWQYFSGLMKKGFFRGDAGDAGPAAPCKQGREPRCCLKSELFRAD